MSYNDAQHLLPNLPDDDMDYEDKGHDLAHLGISEDSETECDCEECQAEFEKEEDCGCLIGDNPCVNCEREAKKNREWREDYYAY